MISVGVRGLSLLVCVNGISLELLVDGKVVSEVE